MPANDHCWQLILHKPTTGRVFFTYYLLSMPMPTWIHLPSYRTCLQYYHYYAILVSTNCRAKKFWMKMTLMIFWCSSFHNNNSVKWRKLRNIIIIIIIIIIIVIKITMKLPYDKLILINCSSRLVELQPIHKIRCQYCFDPHHHGCIWLQALAKYFIFTSKLHKISTRSALSQDQ